MPALAPGSTRWWQLLRAYGPAAGGWSSKPQACFPPFPVPSPLSAQITGVCGLPWGGQLHCHSQTLLYHKNPQLGNCRWFSLSLSLLCSTKAPRQARECPADFGIRVILSVNIFTCCTVNCPEVLWNITVPSHVNVLPVDPFSLFMLSFLMVMANKLLFWVFSLGHYLAENWFAGKI